MAPQSHNLYFPIPILFLSEPISNTNSWVRNRNFRSWIGGRCKWLEWGGEAALGCPSSPMRRLLRRVLAAPPGGAGRFGGGLGVSPEQGLQGVAPLSGFPLDFLKRPGGPFGQITLA